MRDKHDDKMIPTSRENKLPSKDQESENKKARASSSSNATTTTTATLLTPWLKLKDPRIVRVSRAFGGKDRHSKVCTVRGLRDRRIRLSVPTAIQLYDLQDRLGLNQPSKVIDWLLNVAKDDIDELPPLQGSFISNNQGGVNWEDFSNPSTRSVSKDVESNDEDDDKDQDQGNRNISIGTSTANYGAVGYYQFDPSSNFGFSQQITNHHHINQDQVSPPNFNIFPYQTTLPNLPPSRSSAHHHHHVLLYPQEVTTPTTQAYFPSSYVPSSNVSAGEYDDHARRESNHFHMLSSSSTSQNLTSRPSFSLGESIRPFQLSMTSMHIDAKGNDDSASHPK